MEAMLKQKSPAPTPNGDADWAAPGFKGGWIDFQVKIWNYCWTLVDVWSSRES